MSEDVDPAKAGGSLAEEEVNVEEELQVKHEDDYHEQEEDQTKDELLDEDEHEDPFELEEEEKADEPKEPKFVTVPLTPPTPRAPAYKTPPRIILHPPSTEGTPVLLSSSSRTQGRSPSRSAETAHNTETRGNSKTHISVRQMPTIEHPTLHGMADYVSPPITRASSEEREESEHLEEKPVYPTRKGKERARAVDLDFDLRPSPTIQSPPSPPTFEWPTSGSSSPSSPSRSGFTTPPKRKLTRSPTYPEGKRTPSHVGRSHRRGESEGSGSDKSVAMARAEATAAWAGFGGVEVWPFVDRPAKSGTHTTSGSSSPSSLGSASPSLASPSPSPPLSSFALSFYGYPTPPEPGPSSRPLYIPDSPQASTSTSSSTARKSGGIGLGIRMTRDTSEESSEVESEPSDTETITPHNVNRPRLQPMIHPPLLPSAPIMERESPSSSPDTEKDTPVLTPAMEEEAGPSTPPMLSHRRKSIPLPEPEESEASVLARQKSESPESDDKRRPRKNSPEGPRDPGLADEPFIRNLLQQNQLLKELGDLAKERIQALTDSLAAAARHAEILVGHIRSAAVIPELIRLCGLHKGTEGSLETEAFYNGVAELAKVVGVPSPDRSNMFKNDLLQETLSRVFEVLLRRFNTRKLVGPCVPSDLPHISPPDHLWLFVHTADVQLLRSSRWVMEAMVEAARETVRGIILSLLINTIEDRKLNRRAKSDGRWHFWSKGQKALYQKRQRLEPPSNITPSSKASSSTTALSENDPVEEEEDVWLRGELKRVTWEEMKCFATFVDDSEPRGTSDVGDEWEEAF